AELRLHISQMITAYDADPTSSRLLNADGYDGLFGRTLGGLGQQVSIRQAINALMAVIFHETYSIPTPLYTPGTGGTVSGTVLKPISTDPRYQNIPAGCMQVIQSISDMQSYFKTVLDNPDQITSGTNFLSGTGLGGKDALTTLPKAFFASYKKVTSTLNGLIKKT